MKSNFSMHVAGSKVGGEEHHAPDTIHLSGAQGNWKQALICERKRMPRILCLNDYRIALWALDSLLERTSYEHKGVTDGHQALSVLRQEPIDILIQDIEKPGMNGFELYWRMKSDKNLCDIPILVFSAWSEAKSPVKVTPAKIGDKMISGLSRAEFEKTTPKHLSAVAHIKDANVLYLEGYVGMPDIEGLIVNIERILQDQTLLTEEERMFRHQYLWSQAVKP